MAQPVSGAEPVVSTETGWHNSLTTGSGHKGTPESVVGKYMPRLFLFHFNRGIARTYPYELIDEWANSPSNLEANFGLLRYDGSPKPSFTALKNLITMLKDTGATFSPGSLDYSLSGSTANLHKTLLQKRDGTFYLALWVGTQIWNPDTQVETSATPQAITLSVPAGITNAATVVPNDGTNWSAAPISAGNINLSVGDKVILVRLGGTGGGGTPLPDLIVTDVGWTPATPVAGNAVRFSATVKNQGTAATAAGVIMGVSFQVNGSQVSWSDTNSNSLAPGASIILTANGSPAGGNGTWTATAGSHTVEAWVDDINRIAESDESNNKLSEPLTVGSGTLPNPPSSLVATASGKRKINLTWTQSTSTGITQNKVYRSTTGSAGPYTLRATPGAVTSYLDTGLTSGQSYFYVVTAVNGNGESGYSNYSGATAR